MEADTISVGAITSNEPLDVTRAIHTASQRPSDVESAYSRILCEHACKTYNTRLSYR